MIDPITQYLLNEWNLQHDYERECYKIKETITYKIRRELTEIITIENSIIKESADAI